MNLRLVRFSFIILLCLLAAATVRAQSTAEDLRPQNPLASLDYAQAQVVEAAGNYDEAIRLYGKVIDREPSFWPAYYKRGEAYAIMENFSRAVDDYSRVIELQPELALVHLSRAVAYEQLGEHDKALTDSNTAIRLGVSDDYAYFNRGLAHLGLRNFENAIDDFTYWIDLNPKTYAVAYFYRSRAYYAVRNLPGMIADLDIFIELQPNSASVLGDRAYIHRLLGSYNSAIQDYTQAISLEPEGVERFYLERGQTYGLQGDYLHMLQDLRQYAQIAGTQADPAVMQLLKNHPE